MKSVYTVFSVLFILVLIPVILYAQQDGEMSKEDKIWMEYMTPSSMHQMMATHVGEWKTINKFWMQPDAEPVVSEGTAVNEMILGGRYLQSTHSGMVMGMPMNGISIEAYDNAKKVFQNIWIDNMGTGMYRAEGKYDENTKTITYYGTGYDPVQGKDVKFRETLEFVESGTHVLKMYMIDDGKEFQNMEITFTKAD